VIRRNLTPPIGIPIPGLQPTRRAGGARRNVSDRVAFFRAGPGAAELAGWTLNISRGGLRAVVDERVELGEELELQIDSEPARRRGRVVWTQEEPDGTIVGVSFLERMAEAPPGVELDASVEIAPGDLATKLDLTEAELLSVMGPPAKGPAGGPAGPQGGSPA
jgi:hypothetical protein